MHDANRRTSSSQPFPGLGRLCLSATPSRACSRLALAMLARRGENIYTDLSLLDVAGALEGLPELSLDCTVEFPRTRQGQGAEGLVMRAQRA